MRAHKSSAGARIRLKHVLVFVPLLFALPVLIFTWHKTSSAVPHPNVPDVPSSLQQQQQRTQARRDFHEQLHINHDANVEFAAPDGTAAAVVQSSQQRNTGDPAEDAVAAVTPVSSTHDKRCEAYEVHTDTDLLHGDLAATPAATNVESIGACCALCADAMGCVGLTLTPTGECWLKASLAEPMKQRGLTSAVHVRAKRMQDKHEQHQQRQIQQQPTLAHALGEGLDANHRQSLRTLQPRVNPAVTRPAKELVPQAIEPGCSSDVSIGCMAKPAIVVMSHDRPEMTRRCLKILLSLPLVDKFTVYVSEDAGSHAVRSAAMEFGNKVREVLSSTPPPPRNAFGRRGLAKIAHHFRAALEATLVTRGHSHVVMIEDDLLLSPDFLLLFWSSAWLLKADPSLWCVSAWNDQGFPHTTHDATRLQRTGYFPGLGWMISADLWHELRAKWPEAPTTGWDHWMRLSSTSRGRECVAPEINRSRHASSRGTNVLDNKPFERFTFETVGVESYGDLSYLLHGAHEQAFSSAVRAAKRAEWPSIWGGATAKDTAMRWVSDLPSAQPTLLLYTREQYKDLAKPLGLWGENPRAFHNGTIALHPPSGGQLILADRRHSPYLEPSERMLPPPSMRQLKASAGVSCDKACADVGQSCDAHQLEWGNTCEAMARFFPCEAGCGHQVGPELPAYASSPSLDTHRQCLISDIAISTCAAAFAKTERLCTCV